MNYEQVNTVRVNKFKNLIEVVRKMDGDILLQRVINLSRRVAVEFYQHKQNKEREEEIVIITSELKQRLREHKYELRTRK